VEWWPLNLFWTAYLGIGLAVTIVELVHPAHRVRYKKWGSVPLDVVAMFAYQFGMYPVALWVTTRVRITYIHQIYDIPWQVRLVAYYLLADLGSYWLHRLMHTRWIWSIHRFHHSATDLYWLAGVRATIPQQILFNLPYIFVGPLIGGCPAWVFDALVVEGVLRNHWQHMNVAWRSNWLEYLVVTPRYHHLHHSAHHHGNYGSLFSLWDRMFGTRLDPDVEKVKKFGTGEPKKRDPVLMMIGV
jgi:sterol desaturase/sphingolipid hydroxylase (fatty acid hydroxylase superfamily)